MQDYELLQLLKTSYGKCRPPISGNSFVLLGKTKVALYIYIIILYIYIYSIYLWEKRSNVDPVGFAFNLGPWIRTQRYKMKGKEEVNQESFFFVLVGNFIFHV